METKFLRLRTPVELGSRFGDWSVCWLGGWSKHGLFYLVMLVKLEPSSALATLAVRKKTPPGTMTQRRSV